MLSCCLSQISVILVLLAICKPWIRFRWSLYRFRPKSSHLSSGMLGLSSYCHVPHFPYGARICIAYHNLHIIHVLHHVACAFSLLIVVPSVCVLVLGRAGRRVRERGTCQVRLRGSSFRQLWEPCRQDDHTLEITSIFALLVVRSIAMLRYLPLAISCLPYCHVKPLTHLS